MKRKIWTIGLVIFTGIIMIVGYMLIKPLSLACIETGTTSFSDVFKEDGRVIAKESILLYAPNNEKIESILIKEGQNVKKGDRLMTFDDTALRFQLENLEGQKQALLGTRLAESEKTDVYQIMAQEDAVGIAQSDFDEASKNYERDKILFDQDAISKLAFETSLKQMKDAKSNLELQNAILDSLHKNNELTKGSNQQYDGLVQQIDAQIKALQYEIDQCVVLAPMDGIVSEFTLKLGDKPMIGSQMMRLFKANQYEVETFVLSEDAATLKVGAETDLIKKMKGKDQMVGAKIEAIAPTATEKISTLGLLEQRVKVTLSIKMDQTTLFKPGDKVEVQFTSFYEPNCIVIPKDAIFPYKNSDYVWLVEDGKAKLKEIAKTYEADQEIVVESGLEGGEKVIYPLKNLKIQEGMNVKATIVGSK